MSTITTKQLRDDMANVVRELQKGKSVQLSYRHKVIGTLQPAARPGAAMRRGSAGAVQRFLSTSPFRGAPQRLQASTKSFKQEIAELRDNDLASR
jgi:antitoxin (DNA-binding transcriptional repressor) of toxin-antitoxin stability system